MQSEVMYVDMTGGGNVGEDRPKSNGFKAANERLAQGLAPRLRSAAPMNRALALWVAMALGLCACSATIGSPCTQSSDCSVQGNRVCDTSQPYGYCTVFGCGRNSCPNNAVCATFNTSLPGCAYDDYQAPARTARTLCLSPCQQDSDCRASEGYVCDDPKAPPWSATIVDDNQNQKVCIVAATPIDAGPGVQESSAAICSSGRILGEAGADGEEADSAPPADEGAGGAADAADAGAADGADAG
jgi:hypothetical protein